MRTILNIFQILLIWLWTFMVCTLGLVMLLLINQNSTIRIISRIWSWFVLGISRVTIEVEGGEKVPHDRSLIYVSNHSSSFDIPSIFAALPIPLFFLAKSELKKIPFFGWFSQAVGMVFIDRGNHENAMHSLLKAGNEIRKGKNIISFPEGTRTRSGEVNRFKRGTFVLALENNIDIVPIAVIGAREINPPGYHIKKGIITVRIGDLVPAAQFDKGNPDVYALTVENKVKDMMLH